MFSKEVFHRIQRGNTMKIRKIAVFALAAAAALMMTALPSFAALEYVTSEVQYQLDTLPDEYKDAKVVALADFWEEGASDARHGGIFDKENDNGDIIEFDYLFLKADGVGDFVIPFTVEKDGYYKFALRLMGWTASVPRSTEFCIDDGPMVYFVRDYVEENQYHNDYVYGVSAVLTAGEHKVTFSLADDFDDSEVKSLYMCDFYYAEAELPQESAPAPETAAPETAAPETAAPEPAPAPAPAPAEPAPAPVAETAAPVAAAAPAAPAPAAQTGDAGLPILLAAAVISVGSAVVISRRRS